LPDAHGYGDEGSNTLVNTAEAVGGLRIPHLASLGLGNIAAIKGVKRVDAPLASYGKMAERSKGKDSTTGHWELAGIVSDKEFPTYPQGFPDSVIKKFLGVTGVRGILGNKTASGTVIIQELGEEHTRTGFPIVYTSADSVFQIAAHEEVIPLRDLYAMCEATRRDVCVGEHAVGRVIARPFVGSNGNFTRTPNRRDFSLEPPTATILDRLVSMGIETVGIGKVDDLFAGRGLDKKVHTKSNAEGISRILEESTRLEHGLVFANLVDFDMLFGHRNDPKGFAGALEEFDERLPEILETIGRDDMLIITADHGNDPVTPSTDHSREFVPLLCFLKSRRAGVNLGVRGTFADVAQTVGEFFGIAPGLWGSSFLAQVT
jgi:phosphopentomutase